MIEEARFSALDLLSLLGVAQCLYILVYMGLRAGSVRQAALPFLYFSALGLGFACEFVAGRLPLGQPSFQLLRWLAWFSGPPFAVILIAGIVEPAGLQRRDFHPLLFLPLAGIVAEFLAWRSPACGRTVCDTLDAWLTIAGLLAGLFSIMTLWRRRGAIRALRLGKDGTERYWLSVMLLFLNLGFLATMLAGLTPLVSPEQITLVKLLLGLGIGYLAGTSLFRLYPRRLPVIAPPRPAALSAEDQIVAARIEALLQLDKVYQEPSYNRGDLARELDMAEASVSRIVNIHFGKSLPQLLNEHRIAEARYLLHQDSQPIRLIAAQVGFNSIASFNRVFRESAGMTPSDFRGAPPEKNDP